ncbi:GerW family sporulation protein [Paenibacillus sp.]|uniref:GerW family sporulation protein n=1 Tax=Paenibacillus sp. TaxID=58172 RepID=UPI0028120F4C|nr:GerW family sporulation protein [Paenibacillus sp.]
MSEHPIQGLMRTAMENLKQMVDVNTIVGDPVTTPDGTLILPISKVGFGFAAGGSEFTVDSEEEHHDVERQVTPFESKSTAAVGFPFGGGSGGGVSITPIAFLVVGTHGVKVVPLDNSTRMMERIFDSAPQLFDKITSMFGGDKTTNVSLTEFNDVTVAKPMEPIPNSTIS